MLGFSRLALSSLAPLLKRALHNFLPLSPEHRVGLSTPCLAVNKDSAVDAIKTRESQALNHLIVNLFVGALLPKT